MIKIENIENENSLIYSKNKKRNSTNDFYEQNFNDENNHSSNNYVENFCNENSNHDTKLEPYESENEQITNKPAQLHCSTAPKINSTRLNTRYISHRIQSFLKKNQIHKKYFCHKILGTSILLYENLIEKPRDWSKLNSMFKLYFKKMNSFISNSAEQKSFIEHVKSKENRDNQIDDKNDLIRYDISQITINGRQFRNFKLLNFLYLNLYLL